MYLSSYFKKKKKLIRSWVSATKTNFLLISHLDYTAEDFSFLVNTNLQSAFHLSQLAHPLLKASGAGRIVFVSSICSVVSVNIGYPIYSAAKRYSILLQEFACLVKSCSKCCNLFMIKKKFCRGNSSTHKEPGMRIG
jgi:hypothetical protein